MDFIETIEKELGQKAIKNFLQMQSGDVKDTLADTSFLENWIDYRSINNRRRWYQQFIYWYKSFYKEF